jgi:hypothetical protein
VDVEIIDELLDDKTAAELLKDVVDVDLIDARVEDIAEVDIIVVVGQELRKLSVAGESPVVVSVGAICPGGSVT